MNAKARAKSRQVLKTEAVVAPITPPLIATTPAPVTQQPSRNVEVVPAASTLSVTIPLGIKYDVTKNGEIVVDTTTLYAGDPSITRMLLQKFATEVLAKARSPRVIIDGRSTRWVAAMASVEFALHSAVVILRGEKGRDVAVYEAVRMVSK